MGTERARAIETQLGKSMQNKAEGLWSEHCTAANRGRESPLIDLRATRAVESTGLGGKLCVQVSDIGLWVSPKIVVLVTEE